MTKIGGSILFSLVFLLTIVSASIEITQPLSTYNFGDSIYLTVTLNPSSVSGSFEINVICGENSVNVYKISPADGAFSANQEQKVNHKITLTKEYIGNLSGNCYVEASLGSESVSSNHFLLTDNIEVSVKTDRYSYNPGEQLSWSLESTKANGILLNGFVDVSGIKNVTKQVTDGKATDSFIILNNTPAGIYDMSFFVYDQDGNGILNKRKVFSSYEVKQIPTSISVNLISFDAVPGKEFEFVADLFDQSGNKINSSLSGVYIDPKGNKINLGINSGESYNINFSNDSTPGKYKLIVSFGKITQEKEFSLVEYPQISLNFLENSSLLVVKNIGNVVYIDSLELSIGNEIITLELELDIGEEKEFNLNAPDGLYDVTATSGNASVQKQILLTGRAVSVGNNNGLMILEEYSWILILIVAIILLAGIATFLKYRKNKTFKFEKRIKLDKKEDLAVISAKVHMQKQFLDLSKPNIDQAESNLSMKGSKDFCSVLCVNIKNQSSIGFEGKKRLNEIISEAKSSHGVLDSRGSHLLIIYSPLITKTYKNGILASKAAFKIKQEIDSYNKRFKDKIDYNIGIHAGEMISSLNNGKLNYTSLGNTILLAKRISDLSNEKLLVSAVFRQKLMRELKVNKFSVLGDSDVFEVTRIADVEANQDKLKDLLKRTGFN